MLETEYLKVDPEKATKFCEIFTLLLTLCTAVKSEVKISQTFVAFSEYKNVTGGFFKSSAIWNKY